MIILKLKATTNTLCPRISARKKTSVTCIKGIGIRPTLVFVVDEFGSSADALLEQLKEKPPHSVRFAIIGCASIVRKVASAMLLACSVATVGNHSKAKVCLFTADKWPPRSLDPAGATRKQYSD